MSASTDVDKPAGAASAAPGIGERAFAAVFSARVGGSLLVLIVLLAAWEWGPWLVGLEQGLLNLRGSVIPRFSVVVGEMVWLLQNGALAYHTVMTFVLVVGGFLIGSALGAAIGYLLGISRTAEVIASPYILALQIAPKVAFAPLFVMWFGYNFMPKVLVAILIVFFPVLINVLGAVRAIDQQQIDLARSFKATRLQIFRKIEVPASMPALFSGLRIGSTLAVIGVVVGELIGGNTGLGYILTFGQGQGNTAAVFVAIVLLTVVGIIVYLAVVAAEARVLHYLTRRAPDGD